MAFSLRCLYSNSKSKKRLEKEIEAKDKLLVKLARDSAATTCCRRRH